MRNVNLRISKLTIIYQMIGFLAFTFYFTLNLNAQNVAVSGADAATNAASPFATMAAAFASINATAQTGNTIVISVIGNTTEPVTGAILNAGAWTSVSIQPIGGAARTITGAATGGLPLIDFNGADNVIVNGLNTGGNSLTIENTTVGGSGTSTIRFIGGATSNTVTNCILKGAINTAVSTNGAVVFFSTDALTANGNDNNTISNCDIGPSGANLPTKAILGNGSTSTTAIGNSGNTITNNDIHDYFGAAVTSSGVATNGGCNSWTITNNRFYQTGTRTWTTGATHRAIDINNSTSTSGAQGFTITGNTIGYASNTQTGTYTMTGSTGKFQGIQFSGISLGTVSNINNNTIAAVSITGVTSSGTGSSAPLLGLLVSNGLATTNNNTIGSQSSTGSLILSYNSTTATDVIGLYNLSFDITNASNNNIGGISITNAAASGTAIIYGIRINTSTSVAANLTSNIIGGTIANSIQLNATGLSSQVIGIHTSNAPAVFTSNTVRNLTNNIGTGTTTSASVIGINITTSTPNHTVSANTIFNLTNTNTTAASIVTGIQFTGSTANVVERNLIYGLTSATTSTSAEINGIRVAGGTTQYRNNMIALGAGVSNAIGASATNSSVAGIVGINEALGTNQFFHNTVYIGGTAAAGAGSSYAFNGTQTANTRSFRNNIFMNARTNGAATGKHYAVKINGTTANPPGLTINNNVYLANGTGGVFGFFNSLDVANLAAWQTAVGQDGSSFESNPQLLDPTNAVPDLHIDPLIGTVVESGGVDLGVVLDYDGQTRSGLTPVDIGADAGDFRVISCTASVGGTISPSTGTRCANTTYTMTSSGASSGAGITFQWEVSVTGGGSGFTDVTGGTGGTTPSYTTGALSFGTFYYRLRVTCSNGPIVSYSNELTLTVNPIPTVAVSPTSGTICSPGGSPIALVASGADTYAWSPATGLSATTGASVTANPTTTTTYTVTGTTTATGCTNTATAIITISSVPTIASVSATPATICSGENSQLQANVSLPFNSMAYATSTGATLETIISPTTLTTVVNGSLDDGSNPVTPSPAFSFVFNGTTYTNFLANTNGWLRMGTTVPSSNIPSSLTSIGSVDAIFAFGRDANMNVTNGGDLTHGPAAGGKYVFQFTKNSGGGSGAESATVFATMQIVLWGSTSATPGKIEIIYGAQAGTPASAGTIGIVNISNSFINAVNGSTSSTATATTYPITGTLYSFTPQTITYVWTPATFLSSTTIANPLASAVTTTTAYSVTAALGSCVSSASTVTVNVSSGVAIGSQPAPDTKCAGQTSTFTVTASGPGLTYQWRKDGSPLANGGTISGATLATLTITGVVSGDAGNYDVIVTSTCGSPLTSTAVALTVNPLPIVTVSPTSGTICSAGGTPVALVASGADTYTWSPATGLSATTGASVTASPTTTTTYTVAGTTTATGCINTATTTITVNLGLTSTAIATPASVCTGDNSTLNAGAVPACPQILITEITGFETGTGSGTIPFSGATDPIELTNASSVAVDISGWQLEITGTSPAVYTIPSGNIIAAGGTFVIGRGNTGPADIPGVWVKTTLVSVGSGTSQSFILSSGGIIQDVATINGGTPHDPIGTGTPVVTAADWTASSPPSTSGFGGLRRTVTTDNNNASDWTVSSASNLTNFGTANTTFTQLTNCAGTLSYAWTPTTFLSDPTIANPVATSLTSTTNYTVVVTASNGCSATSSVEVTVVSSAVINTQPTALSRCIGNNATFTVVATGPGLNYQWRKDGTPLSNGGTISGATLATLTITGLVAGDAGNYDVIITATCGSPVTSNAVSLSVNALPTVSASNDGPKCVGSDLNLTGTHIGGSTFAWTGPSGFSASTQNANRTSLILAHSGTYTFTATSAAGCTSLPATTAVIVNPTPTTITITPAGPVLLCPSSPAELLTSNGGTLTGQGTVGIGTVNPSALSFPNPLSAYYGGTRHQMIYTSSELLSQGLSAGSVINIAGLNLSAFVANACTKLTIRMKHTASSTLASFENSGLTIVRDSATFTPSATGWVDFTLNTNFVWNGTDNLLVEFTHNAGNGGNGSGTRSFASTTATNMTFYGSSDNVANGIGGFWALATFGTSAATTTRPNMRFNYSNPTNTTWSPTTGLFTDAAATVAYTGTSTNTVYAKPVTTETYTVTASSAAPVTYDGTITESAWGSSLATSAGGPTPGFGAGHEINALYVQANHEDINFGIAGDVQDGNRILLFIDSKTGGYTNGSFGRTGAPQGIDDFNSGTTFDAGFEADYCLVIGTNGAHSNFFFDLYTLSAGGGPAVYLGDVSNPKIGADPLGASNTRGFELAIAKSLLGYIGGPVKTFAMYTSDGGFLSNQFLTRAGAADGNYGSGAVTFSAALPDPITVPNVNLNNYCTSSASVTVGVEGTIVKNTADTGLHSLRSVYNCINEGGTITYDQGGMPATSTTVLTTPLNITKSVTIQGLSAASRPEITVPATGVSIDATKTLTLQNVDVKSNGTATFTGTGNVSITGTTVGKQ